MGRNRGGKGNSGMGGQPYYDTSDCQYCANGLQCPYWFEGSDGFMHHDPSGAKGYVDGVILNGGFPNLPNTPKPGKGDDDEPPTQYPRRKRG